MPKYYFPKSDDVITHNLKSSCRFIVCVDKEDTRQCIAELKKYLKHIKSAYLHVLEEFGEVAYLVFTKDLPVFRHDFFITLAEYIEEPPDETNTVLFSGKVSDLFVASAKPKGGRNEQE